MRVPVNDTQLYFDVEGPGLVPDGTTMRERPVLLALHGGPGFDHTIFKPTLSALADAVQVVYLDLRGQGRSGRPAVESCTLEQMADDVAAFCRAVGLDRPIVLGHSAGGFVALNLAVRHPDVVGRLILVDTAAATADMGDAMSTLERRHGPEARAAAERMFGGDFSPAVLDDFMRLVAPAYVRDPAKLPALAEAIARSNFNTEVAGYYFRERAAFYDLHARLGEIAVPTLVVVGDYDWLTPLNASRLIASAIPGAELVVIPDAGHFAYSEQPELFARAVRRFVAAAPAGVGGI